MLLSCNYDMIVIGSAFVWTLTRGRAWSQVYRFDRDTRDVVSCWKQGLVQVNRTS